MTNDEELLKLVKLLEQEEAPQTAAAPQAQPAQQGPRRPPVVPNELPEYLAMSRAAQKPAGNRRYVLAGIAALAACLLGGYCLSRNSAGETAPSVENPGGVPGSSLAAGAGAHADWGGGAAGGNSTFVTAARFALENRLQPPDFLESIGAGQKIELLKASGLELPKDGKPLVVSVVLCAQLDEATECAWRDAGLFKNQAAAPNPFLRTVMLSSREGLEHLLDWHVDGVLAKPLP